MDIIENILSKILNQDISDVIMMILWKERFNITIKQVKEIKHRYYTGYDNYVPEHVIYFNNRYFNYYRNYYINYFSNACILSEVTQPIEILKTLVIRKTEEIWSK